jgi:putative mRNA 3-end processing factor
MEPEGLYCPRGSFFVDAWGRVPTTITTHAHSDHARPGADRYIVADACAGLIRSRLGPTIAVESHPYDVPWKLGDAWVSLHPAGHVLGSAQVRIEVDGKVVVISGDYKRESDPTCEAFRVQECDLFVTESTFGLPVFQWPDPDKVFGEIHAWWQANQEQKKTSVLFAYALGKSQRLLSGLNPEMGPIYLHGAVQSPTRIYRDAGIALPETRLVSEAPANQDWSQCMVIAVPSAAGSPWMRRFGNTSTAMASGWMAIRGTRRRRSMDRGFVLSDHVDWKGLLSTVRDSKAKYVWVTHGFADIVSRYLRDQGLDACPLATRFQGEPDNPEESDGAERSDLGDGSTMSIADPSEPSSESLNKGPTV